MHKRASVSTENWWLYWNEFPFDLVGEENFPERNNQKGTQIAIKTTLHMQFHNISFIHKFKFKQSRYLTNTSATVFNSLQNDLCFDDGIKFLSDCFCDNNTNYLKQWIIDVIKIENLAPQLLGNDTKDLHICLKLNSKEILHLEWHWKSVIDRRVPEIQLQHDTFCNLFYLLSGFFKSKCRWITVSMLQP